MRNKIIAVLIVCSVLFAGAARAEIRTYQQFKDVATKENGKVSQSTDKKNLFEFTYDVNMKAHTVTRVMIRRLDQQATQKDATVYMITENGKVYSSEAGFGDDVIVAVAEKGGEILVLGRRFAFSSRTSPFSQLITGVYRRVWTGDNDGDRHREHHRHAENS